MPTMRNNANNRAINIHYRAENKYMIINLYPFKKYFYNTTMLHDYLRFRLSLHYEVVSTKYFIYSCKGTFILRC